MGDSFKVPIGKRPTLESLRNMACQVHRRWPALKFRVQPYPEKGHYLVVRVAVDNIHNSSRTEAPTSHV